MGNTTTGSKSARIQAPARSVKKQSVPFPKSPPQRNNGGIPRGGKGTSFKGTVGLKGNKGR